MTEHKYMCKHLAKALKSYNSQPPRVNGLPKVQKLYIPLRPIISNI